MRPFGKGRKMNTGKTRSSLLGIVGAYLIYTAYELFQAREDTNTTMTPAVRIIFMVLFAAAGIGLLVYAVRVWKRSAEEEEKQQESGDDGQNLK